MGKWLTAAHGGGSTWNLYTVGEKKGSELLFKDGNSGPGRLKGKCQVEARKVCSRTLPPMAASDPLSPQWEGSGRKESRALCLRDTQRPRDKPD